MPEEAEVMRRTVREFLAAEIAAGHFEADGFGMTTHRLSSVDAVGGRVYWYDLAHQLWWSGTELSRTVRGNRGDACLWRTCVGALGCRPTERSSSDSLREEKSDRTCCRESLLESVIFASE
ncbi:MAG: hypothetical protein CM1200mP18_03010 [Gammaproteobacteria bacterium]|nr:MAG: hypothetical protein CM1200mP18_03010 [Gammaproteobacteria bacterium]